MSQILPYQLEPEFSSTDERSESEEEEEDNSILSNANTSDRRLDMFGASASSALFAAKSQHFCRKWLKV